MVARARAGEVDAGYSNRAALGTSFASGRFTSADVAGIARLACMDLKVWKCIANRARVPSHRDHHLIPMPSRDNAGWGRRYGQ